MTIELSRHDRLMLVEQQVLEKQHIIEECMHNLGGLREQADELVAKATQALNERDALLQQIDDDGLWGDDFSSAEEYYDHIGFTRQRSQQIRDRIAITKIVNSVDAVLPPVSDLHARNLRKLDSPDMVIRVYALAVREAAGDAPPPKRVEFLTDAALEGVDIEDGYALRMYEELVKIEKCVSIYESLSETGKLKLLEQIKGTKGYYQLGGTE